MHDITHIHRGTRKGVRAELVTYNGARTVTDGNAFARAGDFIVTHKKPTAVGLAPVSESWIVPGVIFDCLYEPFEDLSEGL